MEGQKRPKFQPQANAAVIDLITQELPETQPFDDEELLGLRGGGSSSTESDIPPLESSTQANAKQVSPDHVYEYAGEYDSQELSPVY